MYIYIASNVYVINIFPFALYNFFSPFPPISPHARTPHIRPRSPPPLPLLSSSPLLLALTYTMIDSFFSPYRTFSRSCIMHEFSRGSNLFFFFFIVYLDFVSLYLKKYWINQAKITDLLVPYSSGFVQILPEGLYV